MLAGKATTPNAILTCSRYLSSSLAQLPSNFSSNNSLKNLNPLRRSHRLPASKRDSVLLVKMSVEAGKVEVLVKGAVGNPSVLGDCKP